MASKEAGTKKTWKKTGTEARAAVTYAKDFKSNFESDRTSLEYSTLGKWPGSGTYTNCTRFGQSVLKAGGVAAHIGAIKAPSRLTSPSTTDGSIPSVVNLQEQPAQDSAFPQAWRTKQGFINAANGDEGVAGIGKEMEKYHKFREVMLRERPLSRIVDEFVAYLHYREKDMHSALLSTPKEEAIRRFKNEAVTFLLDQFMEPLSTELHATNVPFSNAGSIDRLIVMIELAKTNPVHINYVR